MPLNKETKPYMSKKHLTKFKKRGKHKNQLTYFLFLLSIRLSVVILSAKNLAIFSIEHFTFCTLKKKYLKSVPYKIKCCDWKRHESFFSLPTYQ